MLMFDVASVAAGGFEEAIDACPNVQELLGNQPSLGLGDDTVEESLSFLEQCWGYGKRVYHQYPLSSSEAVLKQNVINALNAVPITTMRK
jgi:hypothetical protein